MALPGTYDLTIYRGDDFDKTFGLVAPSGRVVTDLNVTSGSPTATSATAAFVASDVGTLIATHDGTGITDGTTIAGVTNSTTITLSANATASGTFIASIRALDCTGYSSPFAEMAADTESSELAAFTFDETRIDVGVYVMSLADTVTELLAATTTAVWDWSVVVDTKVRTLLRGGVTVVADVSKA